MDLHLTRSRATDTFDDASVDGLVDGLRALADDNGLKPVEAAREDRTAAAIVIDACAWLLHVDTVAQLTGPDADPQVRAAAVAATLRAAGRASAMLPAPADIVPHQSLTVLLQAHLAAAARCNFPDWVLRAAAADLHVDHPVLAAYARALAGSA